MEALALSVVAKATVLLAIALMAVRGARRANAALRHAILASTFAAVVALPLAARFVPQVALPILPVRSIASLPRMPSEAVAWARPRPAALEYVERDSVPTSRALPSRALMLASAWIIGTMASLLPVVLTLRTLRRLRRGGRAWPQGAALVSDLSATVGIRRRIILRLHHDVASPMTCGLIHPVIVMPHDAPHWPHEEIRRALVHELEHVSRLDWPVHVATRLACAAYWFHPLIWVAWRRLCLESERACDDSVLRIADGAAYAQQLVTLARRHAQPSARPALSMAGRGDLAVRIAAVLDQTQMRGRIGCGRACVTMALALATVAVVAPLSASAQSTTPETTRPKFEVASVKKNVSADPGRSSMRLEGGRVVITNQPLRPLLLFAYGLQPQQLAAWPPWLDSDRFDIVAQAPGPIRPTPPGGPPGPAQQMMQQLLVDRFRLRVHTESRELAIYALTLARTDRQLGPKMRPAITDCAAIIDALLKNAGAGGAPPAMPQLTDGRPACGITSSGPGRILAGGSILPLLATTLSDSVGRIVQDRTGLTGAFDFELEFNPDATATATDRPSVFTAVEEQLGLKLQPARAPIDVMVIDRVEPPTEN
jgi:uncharacterized protein (TIGR03435 family)